MFEPCWTHSHETAVTLLFTASRDSGLQSGFMILSVHLHAPSHTCACFNFSFPISYSKWHVKVSIIDISPFIATAVYQPSHAASNPSQEEGCEGASADRHWHSDRPLMWVWPVSLGRSGWDTSLFCDLSSIFPAPGSHTVPQPPGFVCLGEPVN